ncbi:MAG: hypothetical protein P1U59_09570 [Alcanivorax sp.]|uniref:hypothetical protein n=1 Tax=Alcanivorax sp. TaxID=1872427 RepID=UPI00260CEB43|nr:hypothetical protein [Alcanivorax sp.]MDF1724763.1 hypothetical protein [Alcanivorax sp.]
MKDVLNTIDAAIKRLVAPTAMLIAATLLSNGLNRPDSNPHIIQGVMALMGLFAFGYMAASAIVAIKEFDELGISFWKKGLFSLSFILVYLVLFVTAIYMGLNKLP